MGAYRAGYRDVVGMRNPRKVRAVWRAWWPDTDEQLNHDNKGKNHEKE